VTERSIQMALHFGHQRYRPLRICFRTSTGEHPHSRHDTATTVGSVISQVPNETHERPARPGGNRNRSRSTRRTPRKVSASRMPLRSL
jgi:hypothetical protein